MVARLLTSEQKEIWMNLCVDILQNIENDPNVLENIITCDESWFFQYGPESKQESMHSKSPNSPRQKKAWQSKSKFKAMMPPPPIKSALKGTRFESVNKLSEHDLQQWRRFTWSGVGIGRGVHWGWQHFYCVIFWIKNVLTSVRVFYSHTTYYNIIL